MGEGPPVIMLHGLLVGNLASWYFTGARAVARAHQVFLYDLRGHGRSERMADGYSVQTMTDDLEALIDGFGIDQPVSLVGHSYGARIALELAIRGSRAVDRLVVVEAPLFADSTAGLTGFLNQPSEELVESLPAELRDAVVRGGRRASRLLDALRFLAYETSLLADLAGQGDADFDGMAGLEQPTLLIYGQDSSCLPAGERAAEVMRHAKLEVLPGGHYLPLEQPRQVSELMSGFLAHG